MCNSNSLWGDNWLWWIILIIILIWVCGGQNGCCGDNNNCCGRLRLLNHARRCPVRRGSAAFSVCAAPAENAVFVTLGKKSGKFQISSCQSGGSVVF